MSKHKNDYRQSSDTGFSHSALGVFVFAFVFFCHSSFAFTISFCRFSCVASAPSDRPFRNIEIGRTEIINIECVCHCSLAGALSLSFNFVEPIKTSANEIFRQHFRPVMACDYDSVFHAGWHPLSTALRVVSYLLSSSTCLRFHQKECESTFVGFKFKMSRVNLSKWPIPGGSGTTDIAWDWDSRGRVIHTKLARMLWVEMLSLFCLIFNNSLSHFPYDNLFASSHARFDDAIHSFDGHFRLNRTLVDAVAARTPVCSCIEMFQMNGISASVDQHLWFRW